MIVVTMQRVGRVVCSEQILRRREASEQVSGECSIPTTPVDLKRLPFPTPMEDKALGTLLLALCSSIFAYYTLWLLLTPFVDEGHFVLTFFPPRRYAYLVPVLVCVTVTCVTIVHLGFVLISAGLKTGSSGPEKTSLLQKSVPEISSHSELEAMHESLTEEQFSENWSQNVEEIIALESIYGNDFSLLGCVDGTGTSLSVENGSELAAMDPPAYPSTIECQVLVFVDVLDEGLTLTLEPGSSSEPSIGIPGAGKIQYLPPISLHLKLLPSYPSTTQPEFFLTSSWLSPQQLSSLCKMLDSHWTDMGPFVPICFTWIDWLKSSALGHLGVGDTLCLADDQQSASGSSGSGVDHRVDQDDACEPDIRLIRILRYNTMRDVQVFEEGIWECPVCMERKLGSSCVRMSDCQHFTCSECIREYCNVNVGEGIVELTCPSFKCSVPLNPQLIKKLLDKEQYERWEALLLQRTLDKMQDVRYCPRCNTACVEDPGNVCQCTKCLYVFCTKCYSSWHPGSDCPTAHLDMSEIEKDIPEGSSKSKVEEIKRLRALDKLNIAKSVAAIESESKRCPSCQMFIHHTGGCNKMLCTYCYTRFCFVCGKCIDGYDHYRGGNCVLFSDDAIAQWEAEMGAGGLFAVQQPGNERDQENARLPFRDQIREGRRCPQCRYINMKHNRNNHIRCGGCRANYCYLCGLLLQKGTISGHFRNTECRQHTDD